ncbi:MAG: YHS domain protein [Rhodospirillaceae bacterium]|nr:YHS domain protein [Rhodospirillaceae bacterium]MBL6931263.1 YHS domain protein [Rhodospirillales bacterium]
MFRVFLIVILFPLLVMAAGPVVAFEQTNKSYFGGLALGGYDAVAYFTKARAMKGMDAHTLEWNGARWLFSSAANRERFAANPETFAPQYGGYCSNQMSLGNLSDIDPHVWRMIDNKLYLFGHQEGRVRWADEVDQKINAADGHWSRYLGH